MEKNAGLEKGEAQSSEYDPEVCYYGFCFLMNQKLLLGWEKNTYGHFQVPGLCCSCDFTFYLSK